VEFVVKREDLLKELGFAREANKLIPEWKKSQIEESEKLFKKAQEDREYNRWYRLWYGDY
jgi:hypothetical protein